MKGKVREAQDVDEHEDEQKVSKTQRKRHVEALQDLGRVLLELEPSALAKFGLPERLYEAILEAQSIKANGARRRQLQYIGKLMRDVDGEQIQLQIEAFQDGSQARKRYDRLIEGWRDRLINDTNGLTALLAEYPSVDREATSKLIVQAREEIQNSVATPKAFRQIYRMLKALIPFVLTE